MTPNGKWIDKDNGVYRDIGIMYDVTDLAGERFTKNTNLGGLSGQPVLWHHGLDEKGEAAIETIGAIKATEVEGGGVFYQVQLDKANKYFDAVSRLIDEGKIALSTGAPQHLVRYATDRKTLTNWPVVELSFTHSPAQHRHMVETSASAGRSNVPNRAATIRGRLARAELAQRGG